MHTVLCAQFGYCISMEQKIESVRPKSVNVLGVDIPILYDANIDSELLGYFCPEKLEIGVKDGLSVENTRLILWHEICHAVECLAEIKISESGICVFSTAFIQLMRHNPDLAWWSFGTEQPGWNKDKF